MASWSHGYNVSEGYTFGFYRELAPDWIDLAVALKGFEPPQREAGGRFRYLELGSGQGFGLCLLAAANPQGEFLGIDFSPEHTAHARSLAISMGLSNVRFVEGDFEALGAAWPADYGEFDYVTLHGIYSWVPAAIRHSLVAILRSSVRAGGAVYVSFNAMPGWVSTLPFQHILRQIELSGTATGMAAIEAGRVLFDRLAAAGSGVSRALPALKSRIEGTRKQPHNYLVQEYLHENWHPLWCSQVMTEFADAKLTLIAPATFAELLLPQILPAKLQEVLADQQAPTLRQDLGDCLINQTFRRDIYVRGPRKRRQGDTDWRSTFRFTRINPNPTSGDLVITTAFGNVTLGEKAVAPLLEAIGEGSRSLAELAQVPALGKDTGVLNQHLILLTQAGWLAPGRDDGTTRAPAITSNAALARLASEGAPYRQVAAPLLGSAISAGDSELMMLDAHLSAPAGSAHDGAEMLKQRLHRLGRRLARDGQALSGEAETAELTRVADEFRTRTLPLWTRLGVID